MMKDESKTEIKTKQCSIKTTFTNVSAFSTIANPSKKIFGILILVSSIVYTINLIISLVVGFKIGENLIIFKIKPAIGSQINEFKINSIFLYLIIFLIIFLNILSQYFYASNYRDKTLNTMNSNCLGYSYVIALNLLSISTILANFLTAGEIYRLIIISCINAISIGFLYKPFKNIKVKKNLEVSTYISFYIFMSLLLCTTIYSIFYSISNIFEENSITIQIIANTLFCLISVVIITHFRDIFFAIFYIYIQIGYIIGDINSAQLYSSIVFTVFTLLSILFTLYKHRCNSLGYANSDEIDLILIHHQYQTNIKMSEEII